MITREEMINEAINRLYMLGLPPYVVYLFMYSNEKTVSRKGNVERLTAEEQFFIDAFENETGAIVYHVLVDECKDKRFLYLLFVDQRDLDQETSEVIHEMISEPKSYKESYPVLFAQRIDICSNGFKIIPNALAIKVDAKINKGLKYAGLTQFSKRGLKFAS